MITLPPLFDAVNCLGGGAAECADFLTAADVLTHLNRLEISRALVWHIAGRDVHPQYGNQQLLAEIDNTPDAAERLIPAFVVTPTLLYDEAAKRGLLETMATRQVRALWCFPTGWNWRLSMLAPLFHEMATLHPALFLNCHQSFDHADVLAFAGEFPDVPIVYTQAMWPHLAAMLDLLRRRPNIGLDISSIHTTNSIELIARHFGPERLYFGTGPQAMNGAAIAALATAQISDDTRARIAHGNLDRILGLDATPPAIPAPTPAPLWQRLRHAEHLGVEIIDAHAHLGPFGTWVMDCGDAEAQAEQAERWMERSGVTMMIVSGAEALLSEAVEGNRLLEERLAHRAGFRGYVVFNPLYADGLLPRFDDYFSRSFFVGFKLLNDYWRIPVTDPRFIPVWEYANAHRLPILLHTWDGGYDAPGMLRDIVPAYPDAAFLLGHSGSGDRPVAEELALAHPNVYLEWCGSFCTRRRWETTLARIGNRQIVFGTDGMAHNPAWELGRLLSIDAPESVLLPILADNMRGVLARKRS